MIVVVPLCINWSPSPFNAKSKAASHRRRLSGRDYQRFYLAINTRKKDRACVSSDNKALKVFDATLEYYRRCYYLGSRRNHQHRRRERSLPLDCSIQLTKSSLCLVVWTSVRHRCATSTCRIEDPETPNHSRKSFEPDGYANKQRDLFSPFSTPRSSPLPL